jgi:Rrf2 family protein
MIEHYFAIMSKKRYIQMLITRASEYAILSLILLSSAKSPMDSDTLSKELAISKSFLAKILQSLAKANILKSYKGVHGGFVLESDPKSITMLEIMSCVEGKAPAVFECAPSKKDCPSNKANVCSIWPFLHKLQGKIDVFLADITLADILCED